METCGQFVEILESTRNTCNRSAATLNLFDPFHGGPQQLLDAREALGASTLIDLEDLVLGFVEQLGGGRA